MPIHVPLASTYRVYEIATPTVLPVSTTSQTAGFYEAATNPLPTRNIDQRRRNVLIHFFRHGRMDDDLIKVCYGFLDDERKLSDFARLAKDMYLQNLPCAMINQSSGWFFAFIRAEVDYYNTMALIHNLAHEYCFSIIAVPIEVRGLKLYYKNLDKRMQTRLWYSRFTADKRLTFYSFAQNIISINDTLEDNLMAKFLCERWITVCHDTWTLNISRVLARYQLESEGGQLLRNWR